MFCAESGQMMFVRISNIISYLLTWVGLLSEDTMDMVVKQPPVTSICRNSGGGEV